MGLRSDLARVRGLGSAKEGTGHWWAQRLTAIALVPLSLWFVASVIALAGADLATVRGWIADPFVAVLLVVLIAATFHHAQLGLQVVIEDYVHGHGAKALALILSSFAHVVVATASIFAILKVAFRSMA